MQDCTTHEARDLFGEKERITVKMDISEFVLGMEAELNTAHVWNISASFR